MYHILHSIDYGHTFELKYLFPADLVWNNYSFVSGRAPGTFYIFEQGLCATIPLHNCITIYFSRDYGATYTPYFNELDSLYTGISESPRPITDFDVFPNPANDRLSVELPVNPCGAEIELFDMVGKLQSAVRINPNHNKADIDISGFKPGIYFLRFRDGDRVTGMKKVVVSR